MPKSTEELYQELLAQGQQYQQQANDLLTQYDSRPAFSYNADTDPIFKSYKDQYVHQGQRAMEDTMGQAAGLTGGYGSSYAQSVGNQAYNEYLTKLNAQIPVLAQQARQAYDAEGDRLLDRYNLALNAANTAYGQGRDALGDLRYEQETAYNRERDALADQRYQDELNYNRQQSELNSARDYATYLLGMGIMPSAEQLAAAGMTPQEAAAIQAYYRNQMALAASGGSGSGSRGSSGGRSSGGGNGNGNGNGNGDGDGKKKNNLTEVQAAAVPAMVAGAAVGAMGVKAPTAGNDIKVQLLKIARNQGADAFLAYFNRYIDGKYANAEALYSEVIKQMKQGGGGSTRYAATQ